MTSSANISPARAAALRILREVRDGEFAERAFDHHTSDLTSEDRKLAHELSYGVLRLRGRLDAMLEPLVHGGLGSLEADVRDALRLGAYQLAELSRVPAYAAVSESVNAARRSAGEGAGRLTNAVLRRLQRTGALTPPPPPPPSRGLASHLTTWGSHPRWLIDRWLARWPADDVQKLVEYNNRRPAVYLRTLGDAVEAIDRLRESGFEAESVAPAGELGASSIRLTGGRVREALSVVRAVVQDPAASAVVDFAGLDTRLAIADLCAAPGGKGLLLAARGHEVVALDISPLRLQLVFENRARLGIRTLRLVAGDATRAPLASHGAVVIDAPCTGTGALARNPDARWRLRPETLAELVALQTRMLDAAVELIGPGGWLIYSTCSLEPEENEEQVADFLDRHNEFALDDARPDSVPARAIGSDGTLTITPQHHGFDGAFAARLRRSG